MSQLHQILVGDCIEMMRTLPDKSVHTCVTSPPYFALRDYGVDGQIGLEASPQEFIDRLVLVFREVHRVLRDDGTLWVNMGDSYAGSWGAQGKRDTPAQLSSAQLSSAQLSRNSIRNHPKKASGTERVGDGWKQKDLMGIPWRLAFALQDDGWYLRQDIIWHKPNPMPESVRDRCTKAHEYLFLLSKRRHYYFDRAAIAEPLAASSVSRLSQESWEQQAGSSRQPGKTSGTMKAGGGKRSKRNSFARETKYSDGAHGQKGQHRPDRPDVHYDQGRNKRSVWSVPT